MKMKFDWNCSRPRIDHQTNCFTALCGAASLEEALDKLRGQDLVTAVHVIKKRFGCSDEEILRALGW